MRIADAVEPLDFHFVHQFLLLPSLEEVRDCFGQQPDLFDQFKQNQADEFKYFHGRFFRGGWSALLPPIDLFYKCVSAEASRTFPQGKSLAPFRHKISVAHLFIAAQKPQVLPGDGEGRWRVFVH